MVLLYQHEKNILLSLAKYYEDRFDYYHKMQFKQISDENKKVCLQRMEEEKEKAKTLRKAAS